MFMTLVDAAAVQFEDAARYGLGASALSDKVKEREGDCLVPHKHRENGFPLGQWVAKQRNNKDALSEGRRQGLETLGFVWRLRQGRSRSSPRSP
jgi:hypothetical protein